MKTILNAAEVNEIINELAHQIYKTHPDWDQVVIAGIQQGGVVVAKKIIEELKSLTQLSDIQYAQLDITFYRDDIRNNLLAPDTMNIPFDIENKKVILIDDVLYTGRTIKAALDVLLDYGRPAKVELCVLIDRKEYRQFPIQANFIGKEVGATVNEKIKLMDSEIVSVSL